MEHAVAVALKGAARRAFAFRMQAASRWHIWRRSELENARLVRDLRRCRKLLVACQCSRHWTDWAPVAHSFASLVCFGWYVSYVMRVFWFQHNLTRRRDDHECNSSYGHGTGCKAHF